jgi:hypothetical protein
VVGRLDLALRLENISAPGVSLPLLCWVADRVCYCAGDVDVLTCVGLLAAAEEGFGAEAACLGDVLLALASLGQLEAFVDIWERRVRMSCLEVKGISSAAATA